MEELRRSAVSMHQNVMTSCRSRAHHRLIAAKKSWGNDIRREQQLRNKAGHKTVAVSIRRSTY